MKCEYDNQLNVSVINGLLFISRDYDHVSVDKDEAIELRKVLLKFINGKDIE